MDMKQDWYLSLENQIVNKQTGYLGAARLVWSLMGPEDKVYFRQLILDAFSEGVSKTNAPKNALQLERQAGVTMGMSLEGMEIIS